MKKGFTLTELIAVIAILSILVLLATGIFINMQRAALEGQYSNIVIDIENKAEEYARDISTTDVLYINVDFLIKLGYIQGDEGDLLYDPRDNSIMNCYMIHVILKDGVYKADLLENENLTNDDGTCDESRIETGTVGLLCDGTNCNNGWYNRDLTLSIKGLSDEEILNSKVEWTSLLGTYVLQNPGEEKILKVSPNTVLNTTYNVTVTTSEETYHITQNILVDKENPIIVSAELPVTYTGNQYLQIDANDIGGSGIAGYAITDKDCDILLDSDFTSTNVSVNQSGTVYVCAKDNAGNIGSYELNITEVTFDYNNTSSTTNTKLPIYYLEQNTNYPLLEPTRNGYTFNSWVDDEENRVYGYEFLEDGDVVEAKWDIIDVDIPVDTIDSDTKGAIIENKVNLILVVDYSSSLNNSDMATIRDAATEFVERISFEAGSTFSIVTFATGSRIHLWPTNNKNEALSAVNSIPSPTGMTNFPAALENVLTIINSLSDLENTYMIFMSDGYNNQRPDSEAYSLANQIKKMGVTNYSIGISVIDNTTLQNIASSPNHYFYISNFDLIYDIFVKIQEEIREEVIIKSQNGLIELPDLIISDEYPFTITIADKEYIFSSRSSANHLLTTIDGVSYLDLVKVDNFYKLNGDFSKFKFEYYYE